MSGTPLALFPAAAPQPENPMTTVTLNSGADATERSALIAGLNQIRLEAPARLAALANSTDRVRIQPRLTPYHAHLLRLAGYAYTLGAGTHASQSVLLRRAIELLAERMTSALNDAKALAEEVTAMHRARVPREAV